MNTTGLMVLSKLKNYKEQANRDRFIMSEDKDISLFTKIVECIIFVSQYKNHKTTQIFVCGISKNNKKFTTQTNFEGP